MENEKVSNELLSETTPPGDGSAAAVAEQAASAGDQAEISDPAALQAQIAAERDRLQQEKDELQDLLQRRQADFENSRKRAEKERADASEYGAMDAIAAVLPVLDDFELALKAAPAGEETLADYVKGTELIYQRLLDILKKRGLEPMESVGKTFDPTLHHAIQMADNGEGAESVVLEEFQRGYFYKGRLLRPAVVKVSGKP